MKVYFVRHGQTNWNVEKKVQGSTDIPLNETGIMQAKELAKILLTSKNDAVKIYSSPQKRALKTAQIAAEALQIPCETDNRLVEMCLGEWEGMHWSDIKQQYQGVYEEWNENRRYQSTPNGESYQEVLERTLLALEDILGEEKEDVLIVTHSAVIMALRCYIEECPFDEENMVNRFGSKNTEVIEIEAKRIQYAVERCKKEEKNR